MNSRRPQGYFPNDPKIRPDAVIMETGHDGKFYAPGDMPSMTRKNAAWLVRLAVAAAAIVPGIAGSLPNRPLPHSQPIDVPSDADVEAGIAKKYHIKPLADFIATAPAAIHHRHPAHKPGHR